MIANKQNKNWYLQKLIIQLHQNFSHIGFRVNVKHYFQMKIHAYSFALFFHES